MAVIYVFMYRNGVPGDIPGIEAAAAINSIEGLMSWHMTLTRVCFSVSAIMSFLSVYSPIERTPALLSFSYSSFLAIVFLPPVRMFFGDMRPDTAILADAAAYFACALLIHLFIIGSMSAPAASCRRYSYVLVNAALTAAGICFLFAGTW